MVEAMEIPKGFKKTEVGIIPDDWLLASYDEVFDFLTTATYSRAQLTESDTIKYVHYGDIHTKCLHFLDCDKIYLPSIKNELLKNYPLLKDGDLIVVDASEDYEGVGKSVEVKNLKNRKAISGLHTFLLRDKQEAIANGFKGYLQPNSLVKKQMDALATGMKVYGVSKTNLKLIKIPLPPTKAEQTAIAEALNDADALIAELEKLIAKKKAIKQGAMQELLKPKAGWEVKKLGEIANIRRGASPRPIKDPKWFSDRGRGWIRISDVTSSSVYLNATTQYLSEDGARNSVAVDKGDLIMSICATIGVPIIINIPACIHDGFVLFTNYEKVIDTFFLYFVLQAQTEILTGKGQPGTQKNLNTTIVGNIEIAYPNIEKQQDIGLILRDIDIELSGLEKKLDKYKMLKQGMMQNLLTGRIRLI
jgi:type I restriction enzyme S subunit